MIALLDYGAGNLTSVRKALVAVGAEVTVPATPSELKQVEAIVVPGVGNFERTRSLGDGWRAAIRGAVDRGAGLLGICLGMQLLFEGSDEAPGVPGLALFRGTCTRLGEPPMALSGLGLKVPHVGWNSLLLPRASDLMRGITNEAQVYFTHSYAAPVAAHAVAVTTHGGPFTAAVQRDRIAGVQFHPEKSGDVGLQILRNWIRAL